MEAIYVLIGLLVAWYGGMLAAALVPSKVLTRKGRPKIRLPEEFLSEIGAEPK